MKKSILSVAILLISFFKINAQHDGYFLSKNQPDEYVYLKDYQAPEWTKKGFVFAGDFAQKAGINSSKPIYYFTTEEAVAGDDGYFQKCCPPLRKNFYAFQKEGEIFFLVREAPLRCACPTNVLGYTDKGQVLSVEETQELLELCHQLDEGK